MSDHFDEIYLLQHNLGIANRVIGIKDDHIRSLNDKNASQALALQAAHKGLRRMEKRLEGAKMELEYVLREEAYWRSFAGLEPALRERAKHHQHLHNGASET